MKIIRHFTRSGQSPYADIAFHTVQNTVAARDNAALAAADTLIVPARFSREAVDILARKGFCRTAIPARRKKLAENTVPEWLWRSDADDLALRLMAETERLTAERDARQVFDRLAGAWTYWGWKGGYFDAEKDARAFYDEMRFMLASQYAAPDVPQWAETGLYWAYGLDKPQQKQFYYDGTAGDMRHALAAYGRVPSYSCYIRSARNAVTGDSDPGPAGAPAGFGPGAVLSAREGAGIGCNLSALPGEEERQGEGGGDLLSCLAAGEAIAAAGADRAGPAGGAAAAMIVVNADHPDIEAYIAWQAEKQRQSLSLALGESRVKNHISAIAAACAALSPAGRAAAAAAAPAGLADPALHKALRAAQQDGLPADYIGSVLQYYASPAYAEEPEPFFAGAGSRPQRGEAAPPPACVYALAVSDDFLRAVEKDEDWPLLRRADSHVYKKRKARRLWDKMALAAQFSSAPRLHFANLANNWLTCPAAGCINASGPHSAYMFLDDTAGFFASLNVAAFVDDKTGFDSAAFAHAARLWTLALDISVSMAQFPYEKLARLTYEYRPLGLGYDNLGSALMALAIPYDSDRGRAFCAALTALMSGAAYAASAEMAAELGAFKASGRNAPAMLRIIRNHRRAVYGQGQGYEQLDILPVPLIAADCPDTALVEQARAVWDKALALGEAYGFRNAQISALAAGDDVRRLLDCAAAALEPAAALVRYSRQADGSRGKSVSPAALQALRRLGYEPEQIAAVTAYILGCGSLENASAVNAAALQAKGFDEEKLAAVNAALPHAATIRAVFTADILGEEFCRALAARNGAQSARASLDILSALGFSEQQIAAADFYICGAHCLEGAPGLRAEDYAVFDYAAPGGPAQAHYLSVESRIRMRAAAQPFLSGGIAGSIAMPQPAPAEDYAKAAMLAWKLGLKASSLCRPEPALPPMADYVAPVAAEAAADNAAARPPVPVAPLAAEENPDTGFAADKTAADSVHNPAPPMREKLPDRRRGYTQKAIIGGHKLYLRTGEFKDGRLGEIFIDMQKEGAAFGAMMSNFAIAVSLGLQYGVPLEVFVKAFMFTRFEPAGLVQNNDRIKKAGSILDYIFRELAISYLHRDDLAHSEVADFIYTALDKGEDEPEIKRISAGWAQGFGLQPDSAADTALPAGPALPDSRPGGHSAALMTDSAVTADKKGDGRLAPVDWQALLAEQAMPGSAAAKPARASAPAVTAAPEATDKAAIIRQRAEEAVAEPPYSAFSLPAFLRGRAPDGGRQKPDFSGFKADKPAFSAERAAAHERLPVSARPTDFADERPSAAAETGRASAYRSLAAADIVQPASAVSLPASEGKNAPPLPPLPAQAGKAVAMPETKKAEAPPAIAVEAEFEEALELSLIRELFGGTLDDMPVKAAKKPEKTASAAIEEQTDLAEAAVPGLPKPVFVPSSRIIAPPDYHRYSKAAPAPEAESLARSPAETAENMPPYPVAADRDSHREHGAMKRDKAWVEGRKTEI